MGFFKRTKHFYATNGGYERFEVFISDAERTAAVGDPVTFVINGVDMPGRISRVSDSADGHFVTATCDVVIQIRRERQ